MDSVCWLWSSGCSNLEDFLRFLSSLWQFSMPRCACLFIAWHIALRAIVPPNFIGHKRWRKKSEGREQDLKQILCRQAQFNWLHDGWADGKSDVNVEKLKLFLKCANPRSFVLVPCPAFTSFFVILNLPPFSTPLELISLIHESCRRRRAGSLETIKKLWKEANHSRTRRRVCMRQRAAAKSFFHVVHNAHSQLFLQTTSQPVVDDTSNDKDGRFHYTSHCSLCSLCEWNNEMKQRRIKTFALAEFWCCEDDCEEMKNFINLIHTAIQWCLQCYLSS